MCAKTCNHLYGIKELLVDVMDWYEPESLVNQLRYGPASQ
jgi:hypothetical protein